MKPERADLDAIVADADRIDEIEGELRDLERGVRGHARRFGHDRFVSDALATEARCLARDADSLLLRSEHLRQIALRLADGKEGRS